MGRKLDRTALHGRDSFRLLIDAVREYAIYMLDPQGFVTSWNNGAERNKGYTSAEILGKHFSCFFLPEDTLAGVPDRLLKSTELEGHFEGEGWRVRKDGSRFWVSVAISAIRDKKRKLIGFAKVTRDLTERKRFEEALIASESALHAEKDRLHVTLNSIADGVICTDVAGNITLMNPAAELMTGWMSDQACGLPIEDVLHLVQQSDSNVRVRNPVRHCLDQGITYHLPENIALMTFKGALRDVQDSAAPIRTNEGEIIGTILVLQDVTGLRAIQREAEFHALHDQLTLLPNRRQFEKRLEDSVQLAHATGIESTLCFLDLDQFKVINDTVGHLAGDLFLRAVSQLLLGFIRKADLLARLSGDEFGIILEDCTVNQAQNTIKRILDGIGALPFQWENQHFKVSASIGVVAIVPEIDAASVMKRADVACYAAKKAGRNRASIYTSGDSDVHGHHEDMQIAGDIRNALSEGRFSLFAQKIVAMDEIPASRYELFLRMRDRAGEMLSPAQFIPAMERFDLMADLDRWVLDRALRHYGPQFSALPNLQLFINLSANSLNDPKFLPFFLQLVEDSVVLPTTLTLEITETALINNLVAAGDVIEKLRSIGCKVALDDFGIGVSSFSYLRHFKVDFIKIDGSFVRNMLKSAVDLAIVKSINNIAHELHTHTIAEHVEDDAILRKSIG